MKIQRFLFMMVAGSLFSSSLLSCHWVGNQKEIAVIEAQQKALGCFQFETSFWDSIDTFLVSEKRLPSLQAFQDQIQSYEKQGLISAQTKKIWQDLEKIIFVDAAVQDHYRDAPQLRMFLAAMEVGDQSTDLRKQIKIQIYDQLKKLKDSVPAKNCPIFVENKTLPEYFKNFNASLTLPEKGMRWLFATAYQNCQSVQKSPLTEETPDVQGIIDSGRHPDGIGHIRKIADLQLFLAKHSYYQEGSSGSLCRAPTETTLIYDYGGKPFSSDQPSSSLDLFKNDGTGSEALGIDCAAAIFSATATVGLRLKPLVPLRARNVLGVNSRMFKDPIANGLECFRPISMSAEASIQSGDIAAVDGHVLMIGDVGVDPFNCENISADNFDFRIWQSGSQKGGIGLNHIEAKDYLKDSSKMREGFEAYARLACKARWQKKEIEPQLEKFAIIRHNGTPDCQAERIPLNGEQCIKECL